VHVPVYPVSNTARSRVVVTGRNVTVLKTLSLVPYPLAPVTGTKAVPFQYWIVHDAGGMTPLPSDQK
jgi:hypothetical protein